MLDAAASAAAKTKAARNAAALTQPGGRNAAAAAAQQAGAAQAAAAPPTAVAAPAPKKAGPTKSEQRRNKHGKVLRSLMLRKMSQHMALPSTQREVGIPTVISVQGIMAIGTSRGFVLTYEANQDPKMILGTAAAGTQHGAVTSIAANHDNTRLLVGHEGGQVIRWDLATGKQLNTINCHPKGASITGLAFTDDHTGAVSNDSHGFVYQHQFKRVLGMRTVDDSILWSAKQGEVCLMQVLHYPPNASSPPFTTIALGLLSQILIVQISGSQLKVALQIARNSDDGDQIPSLAWNFVPIKVGEGEMVLDPVLAFGWGKNVRFMQLINRGSKPTIFTTLGTYKSKVPIITIRWLSDRVIMTMDRQERIHVIDVTAMTLVDIVDLTRVQLTFNDKFSIAQCKFKKRDPRAPSLKAYDQSIASIHCNIYLLGMNSVHLINIMTWQERISFLTSQNKFVPALELAMSFHEDKALAVAAMPKGRQQRKGVTREKLLNLLQAYAGLTLKAKQTNDFAYYSGVGRICIQYCYKLDAKELLFGGIYTSFAANPLARRAFLELLEPMILDNKIQALSPIVMKDMVDHYQQSNQLRRLEECIMHLDVRNLDLHTFVVLCWTHGLYDAMIYVYNHGLNDYTTPLKELLTLLTSSIKSLKTRTGGKAGNAAPLLSKEHQALGYKLLLYTSFCLSGKAFPTGEIAPVLANRVKWEVYHNIVSREGDPPFPYIRTLVQFDTREFLNVLSLAFEEADSGRGNDTKSLPKQQVVVDRLLEIMVTEPQRQGVSLFSPEQVGQLFTFLARQIARHKQKIHVDTKMFDTALGYLSNPDDTTQHEERQQALLELLNMNKSPWGPFSDPKRLLKSAKEAKFYRVMQLIYERQGEHHRILDCYMLDTGRQVQSFSFIHHTLKNGAIKPSERSRIRELVVTKIAALTRIDPAGTARLLMVDFMNVIKPIVATLNSQEKIQYNLLHGIFTTRDSIDDDELAIPDEVQERYIELLCKMLPAQVYPYLRESNDYRLAETLELTRKYRITDATAWLLERKGDLPGAYALIHGTLLEKIKLFNQAYVDFEASGGEDKDTCAAALQTLRGILAVAMQMCLRASGKLNEAEREGLWFPLLDCLINSQRAMKQTLTTTVEEYSVVFRELMRHVVNSMINYVALPAILQKVMADGSLTRSFGEIKDLIMGMVDTYTYEKTLLETTNSIVANDIYWAMRQRLDTTRKGVRNPGRRRRGRRGPATDEEAFNMNVDFKALQRAERESETPQFERMLQQLEAYRHDEGAPPMPQRAMSRLPHFELKTRAPQLKRGAQITRQFGTEVPAEPEAGIQKLPTPLLKLLSTAR